MRGSLLLSLLLLACLGSARAATITWTGATSTAWGTPTNWNLNRVPAATDDVVLTGAGTNRPTNQNIVGLSINSLKFDSSTTVAFTIVTNPITLTSTTTDELIVDPAAANHTISVNIALTGTQPWNIGAGRTLTVTSVISGAGVLTLSTGTGTLILTGTNTYTGVTTINSGVLQIGNAGATGSLGTAAVVDNASLIFNLTSNVTVANTISGSGALTKQGSGRVILSGANSYTGGTIVSAGNLRLGNATALGAAATNGGVVVNGGTLDLRTFSITVTSLSGTGGTITDAAGGAVTTTTLTVNQSSNTTYSGTITAGGTKIFALTKSGSGALTLSGANTYTGATTVSGGTLLVDAPGTIAVGSAVTVGNGATLSGTGTINGPVTFNAGSILSPGDSGIGTLTVGSLVLNAATTLQYTLTTTASFDKVVVTGNLTLAGDVDLSGAQPAGTYTSLITYNGTLTNNGLSVRTVIAGKDASIATTATQVNLTLAAAVNRSWSGAAGAGNVNWTLAANWMGGVAPLPGDNLIFPAGAAQLATGNNNFDAGTTFGSLSFTGAAGGYTLNGNAITLTSGGITASNTSGTNTLAATMNVTFSTAAQTIATSAGGTLTLSGAIDNGGLGLTVNSAGTATFSGIFSGSGALTKSGGGTATVSGGGTFSGTIAASAGTLLINGTLASAGTATISNGATLGGTGTLGGAISVNAGGIVSPGSGGAGTFTAASADFSAGGILLLDVPSNASFDVLNLTGALTAGGSSILKLASAPAASGGPDTVATFGSLTGVQFSRIDNASVTTGVTAAYTGTTLKLTFSTSNVLSVQWNTGTSDSNGTGIVGTSNNATWALGSIAVGTVRSTGAAGTDTSIHFVVLNNGGVNESLVITCGNPTNWQLNSSNAVKDQFTMEVSTNGGASYSSLFPAGSTLVSGLQINNSQGFDLRCTAPASVSTVATQTIPVTITASAP